MQKLPWDQKSEKETGWKESRQLISLSKNHSELSKWAVNTLKCVSNSLTLGELLKLLGQVIRKWIVLRRPSYKTVIVYAVIFFFLNPYYKNYSSWNITICSQEAEWQEGKTADIRYNYEMLDTWLGSPGKI